MFSDDLRDLPEEVDIYYFDADYGENLVYYDVNGENVTAEEYQAVAKRFDAERVEISFKVGDTITMLGTDTKEYIIISADGGKTKGWMCKRGDMYIARIRCNPHLRCNPYRLTVFCVVNSSECKFNLAFSLGSLSEEDNEGQLRRLLWIRGEPVWYFM